MERKAVKGLAKIAKKSIQKVQKGWSPVCWGAFYQGKRPKKE